MSDTSVSPVVAPAASPQSTSSTKEVATSGTGAALAGIGPPAAAGAAFIALVAGAAFTALVAGAAFTALVAGAAATVFAAAGGAFALAAVGGAVAVAPRERGSPGWCCATAKFIAASAAAVEVARNCLLGSEAPAWPGSGSIGFCGCAGGKACGIAAAAAFAHAKSFGAATATATLAAP